MCIRDRSGTTTKNSDPENENDSEITDRDVAAADREEDNVADSPEKFDSLMVEAETENENDKNDSMTEDGEVADNETKTKDK